MGVEERVDPERVARAEGGLAPPVPEQESERPPQARHDVDAPSEIAAKNDLGRAERVGERQIRTQLVRVVKQSLKDRVASVRADLRLWRPANPDPKSTLGVRDRLDDSRPR